MIIDKQNGCLDYWQSKAAFSPSRIMTEAEKQGLEAAFVKMYATSLNHPYTSIEQIRNQQLKRIKYLVRLAYTKIPLYRAKYKKIGFKPEDLRDWKDFYRLPIVTKQELIAAYPNKSVNPDYKHSELFDTKSSGSSGEVLRIKVNYDAIIIDTIQGIRQFWLQSGGKYDQKHLVVFVYTLPWWFGSINKKFKTAFVSSLISPSDIGNILTDLKPNIISLYPTNLQSLIKYISNSNKDNLFLVVTHSEQSSKSERIAWSKNIGVPVLDEYSTEEATRIALELPCEHYHICEDTVFLEALDPLDSSQAITGKTGLAIVTNLLNEAMPFIRYHSGDLITLPSKPSPCKVTWSQLQGIDGRLNDSFISKNSLIVPAGTILDITYLWMRQINLTCLEFELIQKDLDTVLARLVLKKPVSKTQLAKSSTVLAKLLSVCMKNPIKIVTEVVTSIKPGKDKRRPIRSEVQH